MYQNTFLFKKIVVAVGIITIFGIGVPQGIYAANDVTSHLDPFGNSAAGQYGNPYYRNIWDMQVFDNKIFIGSGDSAANAGPVRVWAFDPASGNSVSEYTVDEEQIDRFRVIGGSLYIPGHDATESWAFGNFYTRQAGSSSWTKYRKIPGQVHVYDMIRFNGRLFAAGGVDFIGTNDPTIQVSDDNGQTWTGVMPSAFKWWRIYTMFQHGGELYGSANNIVFKYNPATQQFGVAYGGGESPKIFPSASSPFQSNPSLVYQHTHIRRPVNFLGHLVYVGGYNINDHQWDPVGFYKTSTQLTNAQKITLTDNARVRDIIVVGGTLYALGEIKVGANYIVTVNKTTDLVNWEEILRFSSDTFARSFEMFNGDLYFGMGTEQSPLKASSGNIMRVQAIYFSSNNPPSVFAGADQTIIQPTNSVSISDSSVSDEDMATVTINWSQVSGPAAATIVSPNSINTDIVGFTVVGAYEFELKATDSIGQSAKDNIQITVDMVGPTPLPSMILTPTPTSINTPTPTGALIPSPTQTLTPTPTIGLAPPSSPTPTQGVSPFGQIISCNTIPGPFKNLCGATTGNIGGIVGAAIAFIFAIAVVIALFYLIWGAVRWIYSGGDKVALEAARGQIIAAIVGLIILFFAFLIFNVLLFFFRVDISILIIPQIP